jgi:hypothetical protein
MISILAALLLLVSPTQSAAPAQPPARTAATTTSPKIVETRVYRIRQTVALNDVGPGEHAVRLWVPVPADGAWQHVLDRQVIEAPADWKLEKQPAIGGVMIVTQTKSAGPVKVVVETTVRRESPAFDLSAPASDMQADLFRDELRQDEPLMSVDPQIMEMSRKACLGKSTTAEKVVALFDAVTGSVDHYSKDPTKPKCGRGCAQDCLANGGGCCTDLHSLFIALARSANIPARMQYGYRLNATKEGVEYDPSYRCWIEFYLPGSGWVPTDLVVADAGKLEERAANYGKLDARRVWLWEGRGFDLVPKQGGQPIETMSCGWAEIDGATVNVLPGADGSPSKLSRTISFQDLTPKDSVAAK